jgi:hypothetical protein
MDRLNRTPAPFRPSKPVDDVRFPPVPERRDAGELDELKHRVHALCMEARVVSGIYVKDPSRDD